VRRASLAIMTLLLAAAVTGCGGKSDAPAAPTPSVENNQQTATTAAIQTPAGAVKKLPKGSEPVHLDPATFTSEIDNPWWPMKPGNHWTFSEGPSRVNITVTSKTKRIMGIEARVVHDVLTENGQVVEDTFDWYAQDADGNVWYMGEDTKEFENGKVKTTEGSWQAGVKGAQPGIAIPAKPATGLAYRQEYLKGEAEDRAKVLSTDAKGKVPNGAFDHALLTEDTTPLEPGLVERKYYVRGLGPVLTVTVSGGSGREELLRFQRG
jgi:hypothetical protein